MAAVSNPHFESFYLEVLRLMTSFYAAIMLLLTPFSAVCRADTIAITLTSPLLSGSSGSAITSVEPLRT